MRTIVSWCVLAALSMGLASCSDDSGTTGVDFSDPNWPADFDVILSIKSDSETATVFVMAQGLSNLDYLSLNGDTIQLDRYYDEDRGITYFVYDSPDTNLSGLEGGGMLNYVLGIDGVRYEGLLKIPHALTVSWPPLFDTEVGFLFSWETISSPDLFFVGAYLEDLNSTLIDQDYWQLDSSRRSFSVPMSFFHDYVENQIRFAAEIEAYNYVASGEFIVLTSWDYDRYESPGSGRSVTDSRSRRGHGRSMSLSRFISH